MSNELIKTLTDKVTNIGGHAVCLTNSDYEWLMKQIEEFQDMLDTLSAHNENLLKERYILEQQLQQFKQAIEEYKVIEELLLTRLKLKDKENERLKQSLGVEQV